MTTTPFSAISSFVYKKIVKPIIFLFKPDGVHKATIRMGVFAQRTKILLPIIQFMWSYRNAEKLGQRIMGIHFKNPVGLSAGFDKNIEVPGLMKAVGFGFMEGGTITNKPYKGNVKPWFYRLPHSSSLVVHAGLANQGVDTILRRVGRFSKRTFVDFPLNISVAQTNEQEHQTRQDMTRDCIDALKKIQRSRIGQIITINISCPNTYNGVVFTDPSALGYLLGHVDALKLDQPLFLKMPADLAWEKFDALLTVAAKHYVTGVTICNLTKDRKGISELDSLPADIEGGLSGKLLVEESNELIARTYQKYSTRFRIIGVGGVSSADDAYTKIRLGACLVEMITGLVFEGPQVVGEINRGLAALLEKDGFKSISEAIGIDVEIR
ncbi:MAG: quinone-dependent dihydroorotate dehydrogenase [Candidatus Saccharimonadaceae bacterium]